MSQRGKAQLSKRANDHLDEGHKPPIMLRTNPGMTLGQVLSQCNGLSHFLKEQIHATKESYESALAGNGRERKTLNVMLNVFLCPNIHYLRNKGYLPQEFAKLDPRKEFRIRK